jgi:integrase
MAGTPVRRRRRQQREARERDNRRFDDLAREAVLERAEEVGRTAITNAIEQGEDILLVAAFAGHKRPWMTTDVYGHLRSDRVAEAARRMRSASHTNGANVAGQRPIEENQPARTP